MKICVETLGCKVNTYESEVIKSIFKDNGDTIVNINDKPDVVIINTCTVTNQSDAKSRKTIRKAKRINPDAILVVSGCSSQLNQNEIQELGIDILIGNKDKSKLLLYVNEFINTKEPIIKFYDLNKADFEDMSISHFSGRTRAFVKVQDGCNNYCSYCVIPYVRGRIRNKDIEVAVEEINNLVTNGFKEIVLTGIHTGSYGTGTDYNLVTLIKKISLIEGLERIRISSIDITEINDEFLEELKNNPKICDHLHVPIQNGSDNVLKMMNRKYNVEQYIEMINSIREIRPLINITTDLIVGFPTETDEDFKTTIETVNKIKFGKIHVFPFSKRSGTAAANMKNIVSDQTKKSRSQELIKISEKLEKEYYQKFLNKKLNVLIEESNDNNSVGHTSNYIKVIVDKKLEVNQNYQVLITEIDKDHVKAL